MVFYNINDTTSSTAKTLAFGEFISYEVIPTITPIQPDTLTTDLPEEEDDPVQPTEPTCPLPSHPSPSANALRKNSKINTPHPLLAHLWFPLWITNSKLMLMPLSLFKI